MGSFRHGSKSSLTRCVAARDLSHSPFQKKEKSTIDTTRKSHHVVQRSTKCPSAPSPPHLTTEEREAPLLHYFQEARTMVPEAID